MRWGCRSCKLHAGLYSWAGAVSEDSYFGDDDELFISMIVSGAEDCRYKVWDAYGRLMFTSAPLDHVVTAVKWSPNGKYFAVGSYNVLKLCDRTGWSYCREQLDSGSIFSISWFHDGTQIACGGGNGSVSFASLVDRSQSGIYDFWGC